jgi:putative redox protein
MASKPVVARIGKHRYRTSILAAMHEFVVDEPEESGGGNEGPTPSDLMRVSLASCTAITLRMYADRKGWPVEEIVVQVSSESESEVTFFNRSIVIMGSVSQEQQQRLLEIANSCPIHRMLTHPIKISTEINQSPFV